MDRESVLHREVPRARIAAADGRRAPGQTMKIRVLGCSGGIGGEPAHDGAAGRRRRAHRRGHRRRRPLAGEPGEDRPHLREPFAPRPRDQHPVPGRHGVLDARAADHRLRHQGDARHPARRTSSTGSIWPDFTQIPDGDKPFMVYREIMVGETVELKRPALHRRSRPTTPCPRSATCSIRAARCADLQRRHLGERRPVERRERQRRTSSTSSSRRRSPTRSGTSPPPRSTCARRRSPRSWRRCAPRPRCTSRT